MARAFPLETVRTVARERAEAAARELGSHGRRLEAARAKLAQLEGFREQYLAERDAVLAAGADAARVRDYAGFLARLEEAVRAQGEELARVQAVFEAARARWLDLRRREQAMDTLAARHARAEAVRDQRLDRRLEDEFSQRVPQVPMKVRPG
jgi:flagellar FliJ protein